MTYLNAQNQGNLGSSTDGLAVESMECYTNEPGSSPSVISFFSFCQK